MKQVPRRLDSTSCPFYEQKFAAIAPDARPAFGTLTPHHLFAHLRILMEISTGDTRIDEDISNVFTRTRLFRWMVTAVMPWPKGRIKAPAEVLPAPIMAFEEERELFFAAMRRFVSELDRDPARIVVSPLLGPITLDVWASLHARHNAHHLSQFSMLGP